MIWGTPISYIPIILTTYCKCNDQSILDNFACGMILKPRMILQPKTADSETKTGDSETKNDPETKKKMILKPRMIPKPRTTGNQGSSKNVICKNIIVPTPPHPLIWRRCHVECSCTCAKRRNAAARTLLSPPPPHPNPPAFGDDAMQSVAARILVAE